MGLDTVDDFVWEHHAAWDGTDGCYQKLITWRRKVRSVHSTHELHKYAKMKEEEQNKTRKKLEDLRYRSECKDTFDKFITQRRQLAHMYMIVGVWMSG